MYATVTEISCKSAADLQQITDKLAALHTEVQHVPGFNALYVMQTDERTLAMVTFYASREPADAVSTQLRTHLGHVIGEHVAGRPRRESGEIVLPR